MGYCGEEVVDGAEVDALGEEGGEVVVCAGYEREGDDALVVELAEGADVLDVACAAELFADFLGCDELHPAGGGREHPVLDWRIIIEHCFMQILIGEREKGECVSLFFFICAFFK